MLRLNNKSCSVLFASSSKLVRNRNLILLIHNNDYFKDAIMRGHTVDLNLPTSTNSKQVH